MGKFAPKRIAQDESTEDKVQYYLGRAAYHNERKAYHKAQWQTGSDFHVAYNHRNAYETHWAAANKHKTAANAHKTNRPNRAEASANAEWASKSAHIFESRTK